MAESTGNTMWAFGLGEGWARVPNVFDGAPEGSIWPANAGYGRKCIDSDKEGDGPHYLDIGLYEADGPEQPYQYYLCVIDPCEKVFDVLIKDLPSLLDVMPKVTSFINIGVLASTLNDMKEMMEKTFRATHGHSYMYICRECDPDGFERMQQRRRNKK